MRELETNGYGATYTVEVDPEVPADGDWRCPVVAFDEAGHRDDERRSFAAILRIRPHERPEWVARIARPSAEGSGLDGVWATPIANQLAVCVTGSVLLLETDAPPAGAVATLGPIHQVVQCTEPPLMIFVSFSEMAALGPDGVEWDTARLCLDDLRIETITPECIECVGSFVGVEGRIVLDTATGRKVEGPDFEMPPMTRWRQWRWSLRRALWG